MYASLCAIFAAAAVRGAAATSMKIDFLTMADVRTDPIINPKGLSAHVHRFFGANVAAPSTQFKDLRNAKGNTGNVEENKSLYWHPSIYKYDPETKKFTMQKTSLFSSYYIWETGKTKAFPEGLKFIGGGMGYLKDSRQNAECVMPGKCPNDDCTRWNDFFPPHTCEELEMSMVMPSCWNGKDLDSPDHRSHMAYPENGDPDGACPDSHPVRLPQMRIFTRLAPYTGGIHLFSDGTGYYHTDYMSGWKESFLQKVLDNCENDSFAPMPTAWCQDHVTFRDAPKNPDSTEVDKSKLEKFQPAPFKVSKITKEKVDIVSALPGNVPPMKDITPRCSDASIKKNKKSCRKLRFKSTEVVLGGMYKNWRACNWKKVKGKRTCVARDYCGMLKTMTKCRKFGDSAGCFWEKRKCRQDLG